MLFFHLLPLDLLIPLHLWEDLSPYFLFYPDFSSSSTRNDYVPRHVPGKLLCDAPEYLHCYTSKESGGVLQQTCSMYLKGIFFHEHLQIILLTNSEKVMGSAKIFHFFEVIFNKMNALAKWIELAHYVKQNIPDTKIDTSCSL